MVEHTLGPLRHVLQLVHEEPQPPHTTAGVTGDLTKLCHVLVRELPASGAGVSLISDDGDSGALAVAGAAAAVLEDLQFSLGEGPCLAVHSSRRPLLIPDHDASDGHRWPAYTPAARSHGLRAVFAFPLQVGAARLGALDIYRDVPGPLSEPALRAGFLYAEVAVRILLAAQDGTPDRTTATVDDALSYRMHVYQAQGMVLVDLGVTLSEAMARLRAYAFATGRSLTGVARDVVAGRVVLARDRHDESIPPDPGSGGTHAPPP
jgi:hypothetical protein